MAAQIWTDKAYRVMFTLLPKIEIDGSPIGPYFLWDRDGANRKKKYSGKQIDLIFDALLNQMLSIGAFSKKNPKSHRAVIQQYAWCMSTQDLSAKHLDKLPWINRMRFIAYAVGFLRMKDIIYMESLNFPENNSVHLQES